MKRATVTPDLNTRRHIMEDPEKFWRRRQSSELAHRLSDYEQICHLSGVPLEVFLEIPSYIRHGRRLLVE